MALLHVRLRAEAARDDEEEDGSWWLFGGFGEGKTKEKKRAAAYEQLAAVVHAVLVHGGGGKGEEKDGKLYVLAEGWQGAQGAARAARAAAEACVAAGRGRADVIVLTEHAGWGVDDLLDEAGPLRDVEVIFVAAGGLIGLTGAEAVYEGLLGSGVLKNITEVVRIRVDTASDAWSSPTEASTIALPPRGASTIFGEIVTLIISLIHAASDAWSGSVDWIKGRFTVAPKMGLRSIGSGPPYEHVVVAGTFDRLHAGHRLLIFAALMVLKRGGHLWLGVTGDALTASKKLRNVLEPYAYREAAAARFARSVLRNTSSGTRGAGQHMAEAITIHTGEITNPRRGIEGQPEIDALVVSEETSTVSNAILIRRMKQLVRLGAYMNPFATQGHKEMSIVIVGVVSDGNQKISSTQLREMDAATAAAAGEATS